jgi:transketolase
MDNINNLAINTIKFLGLDAINKANSGHPGMVLGAAPLIHILYSNFLTATPKDSLWINRDRFILAAGHASMLTYAMLHLTGYKVGITDLKSFRQINSITPGHPEFAHTDGIDATSGPLGQGIAHAVGMALAEKHLSQIYNKEEFKIINHHTYALCGDGDMQEGVTQEAISLAGQFKLNKLILIYDFNAITLDDVLSVSNSDNVKLRFKAMNWSVLEVADGNDLEAIEKSIKKARKSLDSPTLIIIKSIIGQGSKNENTSKVHGAPLGEEDTNAIKARANWTYEKFNVPPEVYQHYQDTFTRRGSSSYKKWLKTFTKYSEAYPDLSAQLKRALNRETNLNQLLDFEVGYVESTRNTSNKLINYISTKIPYFIGGSADVAKSVNTTIKDAKWWNRDEIDGKNIPFGIREFAMSGAQSGMLLHQGIMPYVGTFLVFSDYLKPSLRLAALMGLPSIYLFSHDSVAVGEDGPTHQPIEQVPSLRTIPNTVLFRPANAVETSHAWNYAINNKANPVSIVLTRQDVKVDYKPNYSEFIDGAYILNKNDTDYRAVLIATGSEVNLAIKVKQVLASKGVKIRVVSLTSTQLFDKLDTIKKLDIIGNIYNKTFVLEMSTGNDLYRYGKHVIGINEFGKCGKMEDVIKAFNFDEHSIAKIIEDTLAK